MVASEMQDIYSLRYTRRELLFMSFPLLLRRVGGVVLPIAGCCRWVCSPAAAFCSQGSIACVPGLADPLFLRSGLRALRHGTWTQIPQPSATPPDRRRSPPSLELLDISPN
jgi:hypothetical protein